jgi:hypothetical protein
MELWLDTKESLAQMCENGKVKNRLRGKMVQLNSPKSKKSLKEIRNQNSKPAFYEIAKNDDLKGTFIWGIFSFCITPLNDSTAL